MREIGSAEWIETTARDLIARRCFVGRVFAIVSKAVYASSFDGQGRFDSNRSTGHGNLSLPRFCIVWNFPRPSEVAVRIGFGTGGGRREKFSGRRNEQ